MLRGATVLFDLDGTMIDTAPDLIHAANHTLELRGLPPVGADIIRPAVSHGSRAMIRAALDSHGREETEDELTRMTEAFTDYYSENILVDSRPFPGLFEAIEALRSEGALLGVCTNKREEPARKLLALLKIDTAFQAIGGRDSFTASKPDPIHVLETIRLAGGDPARAVMIGDSSADSLAAQAAGVPFIGVTFGYGESPIQILNPDAVIERYGDLMPAILGVLGAGRAASD